MSYIVQFFSLRVLGSPLWEYFVLIGSLVFSYFIFGKKGLVSLLNKLIKGGIKKMKYRKENYQEKEKVLGQSFSNIKSIKRLNKQTGLLEDTGEVVDIDELVKSCLSTALDEVLNRFMPQVSVESEQVYERNALQDDLDYMQESFVVAEDFKKKYGLDENLSPQQVFEQMQVMVKNLNDNIAQSQKVVKSIKDVKEKIVEGEKTVGKEVVGNEKEAIEKS